MLKKIIFNLFLILTILVSCNKDKVNKAPIAKAGLNQVVQLPLDFVTLSGSAKDDDGTIVSYTWSLTSGPNNPSIQTAGSAITKVSGLIVGTYIFQLSVVDNSGATAVDAVSVTVLAAFNKVPVANAGNSVIITVPTDVVTLSGSGSDTDGNVVAYLWSQVSGPFASTIDNPGSASTQIRGLKEGKYVFQLMVTDNKGATGVDTASVTVNPNPIKTLILQPGPTDGIDTRPATMQNCATGVPFANIGNIATPDLQDLAICAWTFNSEGCSTGQYRSYLKFAGLSAIPQNATIISVKLSLYGVTTSLSSPQGNSYYPGSPYNSFGTNECWIKRVTGDWNEATLTWNNQPAATELNRVAIPASTSQWGYNVIDLDVTNMVKEMVNNANSNFGFVLMHQIEQYYRSVTFGSSDNDDPAKRPKLVVVYQ